MKNWLENVSRPIIGLAPMHDVTDTNFRQVCKVAGADVVYTEMVAAEAVVRRIAKAFEMMSFDEMERPVVVQIFGSNPETMLEAAQIIENELHPDGIDINFGCPVQKAAKQGFGSVQLGDIISSAKIIKAVSSNVSLPVSFKMRAVSKNTEQSVDFAGAMFAAGAVMCAIHGRTPSQKYGGQADWNHAYDIKKAFPEKVVLGNGDIDSKESFKAKLQNLDGVLIGRAAKRNPMIFEEITS